MIRHSFILATLGAALILGAGCKSNDSHTEGHDAKATMMTIDAAALPEAVKTGFAKAYPGATITKAEKETYKNGTVHYEIEFKNSDGSTGDAEFDTAGMKLPEH